MIYAVIDTNVLVSALITQVVWEQVHDIFREIYLELAEIMFIFAAT